MAYVPSTAAQNTASLAGSNQASLASPLTALQTSIAAGNQAPAALIDAILASVGYQGQQEVAGLATTTTTSTTFVPVGNGTSTGWATWSFTAPVTKTYLLHVDIQGVYVTTGPAFVFFQVTVDGVAQPALSTGRIGCSEISSRKQGSFRQAIALTAGTHTIGLNWRVDGNQANLDTSASRLFTITG